MRSHLSGMLFVFGLSFTGCSGGGNTASDAGPTPADADGSVAQPSHGFQIETPEIPIGPGGEETFCYYTTVPTDVAVGVKEWSSVMTLGSHHMILFFTDTPQKPDGTIDQSCGFGGGVNAPIWTYSSQQPVQKFEMPPGVGMAVKANQPVIVQMHYFNAGDDELQARVTINAETFEDGVEYKQAFPFITYNTQIDVPAGQAGSVEASCDVPAGVEFFTMSTHSHQFSTRAQVFDTDAMLVDTTDWEHPEIASWNSAPYTFSGKLRYRCEYFNTLQQRIQTGDSAETDEMCMAVGYFFPGTQPMLCLNDFVIPL